MSRPWKNNPEGPIKWNRRSLALSTDYLPPPDNFSYFFFLKSDAIKKSADTTTTVGPS